MNNVIQSIVVMVVILSLTSCQPGDREEKNKAQLSAVDSLRFSELGDSVALDAQQVLVSSLMSAIEEGGTAHAVEFCNLQAGRLTDSLSKTGNYRIGRISEKYRNPDNRPANETDTIMLKDFRQAFARGEMPSGRLVQDAGELVYYKGITIAMPTCLSCHGDPGKDIEASTLALIREKYPEDKATGYRAGDFRGLWKIIISRTDFYHD